jgi:hypothetical protein
MGGDDVDYKDMIAVGLFSHALYEDKYVDKLYGCARWSPDAIDDLDGAYNAARFFGAFGYIMHTLAFFITVVVMLFVRHERVPLIWMILRGLVIVSFVCSLLIFTAYDTEGCEEFESSPLFIYYYTSYVYAYEDMNCVPGAGGIIAIFNVVLILASLVFSWLVCAPEKPVFFVRMYQEGDDNLVVQPTILTDKSRTPKNNT